MKTDCACGTRNPPWAETCAKCGRALQSAGDAAARKREWDALPAATRASMEADFAKSAVRAAEVRSIRRRRLIVLAVCSAIAFPILIEVVPPKLPGLGAVFAAPFGLAAAFAYHRLGPGATRGALIYTAAYLAATFAKLPFCETSPMFWSGQWLYAAIMATVVCMLGWGVGFNDRDD